MLLQAAVASGLYAGRGAVWSTGSGGGLAGMWGGLKVNAASVKPVGGELVLEDGARLGEIGIRHGSEIELLRLRPHRGRPARSAAASRRAPRLTVAGIARLLCCDGSRAVPRAVR